MILNCNNVYNCCLLCIVISKQWSWAFGAENETLNHFPLWKINFYLNIKYSFQLAYPFPHSSQNLWRDKQNKKRLNDAFLQNVNMFYFYNKMFYFHTWQKIKSTDNTVSYL
jgi:hypothetical protein